LIHYFLWGSKYKVKKKIVIRTWPFLSFMVQLKGFSPYNGPIFLHLYGFKCMVHVFVIIIILKGLNLMILNTFTYERKIKSKQYKHFKWGTFKFDPLKCNNTQTVCIWIHNFQILHWWSHEKFKIKVSKPFSRWHGSIRTL